MIERSVLIIGNFLSRRTGAQGVCEDLASHLADNGWRVHTASTKQNRAAKLIDMVATAWRKRKQYRVAQIDLFHGPAFIWAEATCTVLRCAGRPYVLTLHGGDLPNFARRRANRVARLLRSAEVVTTPSRYLYDQMRPYCDNLHLLPNSLDVTRYAFRLRQPLEQKLIWLRAFHHTYNPSMALRSIAELKQDFPRLRLTMIGPDKGDGSLQNAQRMARELGVAWQLTIIAGVPKSHVPAKLQEADIFLNTTNEDNTPISLLEAMASGLCVVSTNVGGIPYLLEDGHDALLVPPDDARAMAEAVRRLLDNPTLAHRIATNARRKVEGFDWAAILPHWEALLQQAAARRRDSTRKSSVYRGVDDGSWSNEKERTAR